MFARASAPSISIRLFGAPSIETPLGPLSSAKPVVFGAALYLALSRGRAIRREELGALLWPDASDAKRGERMRWLVRQLRLAGLAFASGAQEIVLPKHTIVLDTDILTSASSAAELLVRIDDVLTGYDPRISDRFSHWLERTRTSNRAALLRALGEWLAISRRSKSWLTSEAIARRMLALEDDHADAAVALSEALTMQGKQRLDVVANTQHRTFVGRADALARLMAGLVPSSLAGHRLGVAGPAGIGKSCLVEEFARRATARAIPVVTLRCQRGDALRPLSLAVDLTRALIELPGAIGATPHSLAVLRRFTGEQPSPESGESAPSRRGAVHAALCDLVAAVADEAGLAVVIDDAQWAERGSWALLAPAGPHRSASPLCWVAAIRSESEEAALEEFETIFPGDDALSEQERELLWLEPLESQAIAHLCVARAAPRPIPPAAVDLLVSRAAGIPFIAEALVDHWLELGDLASLPASVTRLIRRRLDRLPPNAQQLLRVIAVLGLDATPISAQAVAQFDRRELVGAVSALEAAGILRTLDGVLSTHALWTEAALARTGRTVSRLIHQSAAEWLEQRTTEDGSEDPRVHWTLAMHWLEVGDHAKARTTLDRAAVVLIANGFSIEAATMLERAGDLAGVSPDALAYYQRAGLLWMQEFTSRATEAVNRLRDRFDRVAQVLDVEQYSPHHELEFLSKVAIDRNIASRDDSRVVPRILCCATDESAPTLHRLRAASNILHQYNRSGVDADVATTLWHAITKSTPTNEQEAWEYDICAAEYHARVLGTPDIAMVHASRAVAIVMTSDEGDTSARVRVGTLMANCYEVMGNIKASIDLRYVLLELSRKSNNGLARILALDGLLGTLLELGKPADVRPLLVEFGRPSKSCNSDDVVERSRVIYWVVCALEEDNAALARAELVIPLEAAWEAEAMDRARVLSMYAHLALLEGDEPMLDRLLSPLLACFTGGLKFMDHPALVAALMLERRDGWDAAANFVRRFITVHRDEQWTPRAELCRFLDRAHGAVGDAECDTRECA